MSELLHKHYFPPVCILTHCWCCGLRTAVVTAAGITSFLAACGFVFSVYCIWFGVFATGTYAQEYYIEMKFNNTMYMAYKKFNSSAQIICEVAREVAGKQDETILEGRSFFRRRSYAPDNFNLDKLGPDLLQVFSADEVALLGANLLDYGTESGRAKARSFVEHYHKWRMAALGSRGIQDVPIMSYYNFHQFYPDASNTGGSRKTKQKCSPPFLGERINVDKKMNALRVALFGTFLLRTHRAVQAIAAIDLVASLALMIACILLIWGVMKNSPGLILPWLIIAGFYVLFNLVFVDIRVTMIFIGKGEYTRYVTPIMFLLSAIVIVFLLLALFAVASYLFLIFTTDFYLRHLPRSTQVVASGTTDTLPDQEMAELMESLRLAKAQQRRAKQQAA